MPVHKGLDGLQRRGLIGPHPSDRLKSVSVRYAVAITETMAQLAERNPDGPVARQFLPTESEADLDSTEITDPIGDQRFSPVKGIVHRYPDRVLLKLVHTCPLYCRFCFRREQVGPGGAALNRAELQAALSYVKDHPDVWEVVLSGGDPMVLPPRRLADLFEQLNAIETVQIVRIHTRVPVVQPAAVSDDMIAALRFRGATYVVLHVNHAEELTAESLSAIGRLASSGIPLLSQTVLLKGINDRVDILETLFRSLVAARVKPYYLHQLDKASGTSHFRVPIEVGQNLVRGLRGRLSGLCQPTYMLDIPGGHGKVPIGPNYLAGKGDDLMVEDPWGKRHRYLG